MRLTTDFQTQKNCAAHFDTAQPVKISIAGKITQQRLHP